MIFQLFKDFSFSFFENSTYENKFIKLILQSLKPLFTEISLTFPNALKRLARLLIWIGCLNFLDVWTLNLIKKNTKRPKLGSTSF